MNYTRKDIKKVIREEVARSNMMANSQKITEGSVDKALSDHFDSGFIIISADRPCVPDFGGTCSVEEQNKQREVNAANEKEIKKDIEQAGFKYIPTHSGRTEVSRDPESEALNYNDVPMPELAFIIPAKKENSEADDHDFLDLKSLGVALIRKYGQDSFLFNPPSGTDSSAFFIGKDGGVQLRLQDVSSNELVQSYFSRLRKEPTGNSYKMMENKTFLLVPKPPKNIFESQARRGEVFVDLDE